jgi:heterodisulfide reductase subunit D
MNFHREVYRSEERKKVDFRELAKKCLHCGLCTIVCPVYRVKMDEYKVARGRNLLASQLSRKRDFNKKLAEKFYACTMCMNCKITCPAGVQIADIVESIRKRIVEEGCLPEIFKPFLKNISQYGNPFESNEDRSLWIDFLTQIPDHMYQKEKARVIYFVGCVAAFFPLVQKIPQAFVRILDQSNVDFTTLGGEEWCCGFPLIQMGMEEKMQKLVEHNQEKVKEVGAENVVFACPSCYHTWKEKYKVNAELLHSTQFLERLINEGKITFKNGYHKTVTYHDPCDLGRNSGIYEAPRNILKQIPGLRLVELKNNQQLCVCCGGGGDLEMTDPELSAAIAQRKIEEIQNTEAEVVVTSCQQCIRTISGYARKHEIDLKVMDITEVVLEAMGNRARP